MSERNEAIFREWIGSTAPITLREIAKRHGISAGRVQQIVHKEWYVFRKKMYSSASIYRKAAAALGELARQLENLAEQDDTIPPGVAKFPSILDHRIDEWNISVRSANCLKNEGVVYQGDLVALSEAELLRVPNFGRKSLREIKGELTARGLNFSSPDPTWIRPNP